MQALKHLLPLALITLVTITSYQNCGTNIGDPNLSSETDVNIRLSSYDDLSGMNVFFDMLMPKAHAQVTNVSGCLQALNLLRYDERWAGERPDGSIIYYPERWRDLPFSETHAQIQFNQEITFDPNGTPLGIAQIPQGRFIRIALGFSYTACEPQRDYSFTVSNDNGDFFNGPTYLPGRQERWTSFRIRDDVVIDENVTGMEINIQGIIDYLDTVDENEDIWGATDIEGLIILEND
jgi:hypothetical protein